MQRVVVVGGGFGGLYLVSALKRAPVDVTLIDCRNHHLFQPLLYQVATGSLSPANIAAPLRALLARQKNARVLLGEAIDFDLTSREVVLKMGARIPFDTLIVATGSTDNYFGHPEWQQFAPGLKSIDEATEIRRRILMAFEAAERESESELTAARLTFVVVGGGPTGVEMAGAVAEMARTTLRGNFRSIDPAKARVVLIEGADRVLPPFVPKLSEKALQSLQDLGVEVQTGAMVTQIDAEGVTLKRGDQTERIASHTVLWAAGVRASPLGEKLAKAAGIEMAKGGRVPVESDLSLHGHPDIFVIGDMSYCEQDGKPLPGLAPVAIQQGKYVAGLIRARLKGKTPPAFHYHDRGVMATIGRFQAVADLRGLRFGGGLAWLLWLFVHLMLIVEFENRLLVLIQWAWHYTTRNRAARLITGRDIPPHRV
jgi:NADH dehydrogenase